MGKTARILKTSKASKAARLKCKQGCSKLHVENMSNSEKNKIIKERKSRYQSFLKKKKLSDNQASRDAYINKVVIPLRGAMAEKTVKEFLQTQHPTKTFEDQKVIKGARIDGRRSDRKVDVFIEEDGHAIEVKHYDGTVNADERIANEVKKDKQLLKQGKIKKASWYFTGEGGPSAELKRLLEEPPEIEIVENVKIDMQ